MRPHDVIRRPVVTEKSNIGREEGNLATFAVDPRANKHDIRRAIQELFHVDVVDIRTMRQPRKSRRIGRNIGRRPEWKKAIVRLAEGQSIELKLGPRSVKFTGTGYIADFVLPNFYFHMTTAYNILRHNGVVIGKRDYLGDI